jgi:hypothetical protein
LTSASTTFTWSAATGASSYYLWVGTTPGGYDLANMGPFSGTSATVTLPTNGTTIYVRLWPWINGGATQLHNDYTYTEAPQRRDRLPDASTALGAATCQHHHPGMRLSSTLVARTALRNSPPT